MTVANNAETTEKKLGGVTGKGFVPGDPRINREGRPKKRLLDELLTELLEAADSKDARAVAKALIKKASKGDARAARLIAERTQGKPTQKVEVTGADGGPVDLVINFTKPNGS